MSDRRLPKTLNYGLVLLSYFSFVSVDCSFVYCSAGEISNQDREMKKCLVEAFKKTDDEFLAQATAA